MISILFNFDSKQNSQFAKIKESAVHCWKNRFLVVHEYLLLDCWLPLCGNNFCIRTEMLYKHVA